MRTLHLVSHTHWDREWYRTFQQFRLRLVHLVDGVLDLLEAGPEFRTFMLDGQTIVLDDYLLMRPENEERLRHFVQDGRLTIGPWHILPDEFLVSPEATIRNLLEGGRTCRRFGPKMDIGYIPDPFGHIGQMPQILKGFSIHAACVQRGLSDESCEFWWESPDGSRVFMAYLRDGYGNAAGLPTSDPKHFVSEVIRLRDNLIPHSAGDHLLLMHGTDHMEPPPATARLVEAARGHLDGDKLVHSSLPDYIAAIQTSLDARALPVVHGELRDCKRSHLLPGVLSTRMWIKQRNRACENLLEKWAEPFSTFASLVTASDRPQTIIRCPSSIVRQSWRLLMENHPHDSICGCSIDQVHDEMKVRFDQVEQIGEEITRQSLDCLAKSVNTSGLPAIIVFNPISSTRTDVVEASVESPVPFDLLDDQGNVIPYQTIGIGSQELIHAALKPKELQALYVAVHDGNVMGVAIQDLKIKRDGGQIYLEAVVTEHGVADARVWQEGVADIEKLIADPAVKTFHIHARSADKTRLVFTANVPGLGWQTYRLRPRSVEAKTATRISPVMRLLLPLTKLPFLEKLAARPDYVKPPYRIENDLLAVEVRKDGTLTITDKVSGGIYRGLNCFVDGGDCGDEYNYCPPVSDRLIAARLKGVAITRGPVKQTLRIEIELPTPASLVPDRKSRSKEILVTRLTSHVTLARGIPRVDIRTEVENQAKDHRLRVHFPAPFAAKSGHYDGHFEVLERPIGLPAFDETWVEQPRPEVPQRVFTSVADAAQKLTVANRGLPEVEVLKNAEGNAEISITLLRCVGWLSRDDFANRKGHAGPLMETPGAQMIGKWVFDYSIIPHVERDPISSYHQAYAFEAPLRAVCTDAHPGSLPPSGSFVAVTPGEFVVSAVKQMEEGNGWLVRGYNISGGMINVTLKPWRPFQHVERITLSEGKVDDLKPDQEGTLSLQARGHEIVSIMFRD
jgi:alpha-mannosidase